MILFVSHRQKQAAYEVSQHDACTSFTDDMNLIRLLSALSALALSVQGQEISEQLSVQDHFIGTNTMQRYFLIEHKSVIQSNAARGLVLILPGGPGSAEFLPFCANVLTLYGIPTNFVAAELVAPQWSQDENRVVWPGRAFPDPQAKFSSEQFLQAVIKDVCRLRKIDERYVFTLGWSSSGHVLYSVAASEPAVRGSIIAMSRFLPDRFGSLDAIRGKNFFLYHSPEDQICPFSEAQLAESKLKEHGAGVKLVTYKGGHGWVANTFYCDRIKEGIEWLKNNSGDPDGVANRSRPVRSETNSTPSSAGCRG